MKVILLNETKRQKVMRCAFELFAQKGYDNTNISEIADKVGISVGSIYAFFKSKEDLLFATTDEYHAHFMKELNLHLATITGSINKLRKFIWVFVYFLEQNPEYTHLLLLRERHMREFIESKGYKHLKEGVNLLLEIIVEGQKEGVFRSDIDKYLARHLVLGFIEHIFTRWLLKNRSYTLSNRTDEIIDMISASLSTK